MNSIRDLETPAAVVDIERMAANLQRSASYCRDHGLDWRPHTKTHKTAELGAAQLRAGAVGLTVATPREAEVMAGVSDDVLLAYPPLGPARLERLMALPPRVRLTIGLDSREALQGLADASRSAGRTTGVLIELDVGMRRVGLGRTEDVVALAREAADLDGIEYRGIMFYPGHIRAPVPEQTAALQELSNILDRFVGALDATGLRPGVVSGGSTPTLWRSHEIRHLTEVRPGTNIFNDRTTALVAACEWEECAYSVVATVVSTAVPGRAVVDAGSKALSREELRAEGGGYAALLDRPEVVLTSLSEEHGILDLSDTTWRPRVGDRVRIIPNHVCVSVNLQDRIYGVRGGDVCEEWNVAGRGRLPFAASTA